jgi:murein DD-endopeptidase MepM/ murein hydrolase activator NlpD
MLLEFTKTTLGSDNNVFKYLEHDQPLNGIKTTLITTVAGGVIANDPTATISGITITYPNDIQIPTSFSDKSKDDFVGASYWISDKPANNFEELQGFSRYRLTNEIFKTSGSIFPDSNHNGSIEETFTPLKMLSNSNGLSSRTNIAVNPKLYSENSIIFVDVYTPYTTKDGYPTKSVNGISKYKLIQTIPDYKEWLNTNLVLIEKNAITNALNTGLDIILLPFDTSKITNGKVGEKYFVTLRYLNQAAFTPKIHEDVRLRNNRFRGLNFGNSPVIDSGNFFNDVDKKPPVVLGFGTVSGQTSPLSNEFVYGASFSDPYSGETTGTTYQANVLGAISNGNSYISFIAIGLESELKTKNPSQMDVRSYINKDVLGTKELPKAYTILDKTITSEQIYKPEPKKYSNNKKTKVSGWVDPLKSINIRSDYGNRVRNGRLEFHEGIDLRALTPLPVFAVLNGKVVAAGEYNPGGYARVVVLAHQDKGISTMYAHLSKTQVSDGSSVTAGDMIGLTGEAGSAAGQPHLHFEVRNGIATSYSSFMGLPHIDPETYLSYNSASPDVKTVTPAETEANKIEIKNYLKDKGFSKIEVAAVLGNIHKETGGTFNPYTTNKEDENGYPSLGLIQWNTRYIGGGTKDTEQAFKIIGLTVAAQMIYMTEGAWKNNTDRFRDAYKNKLLTIDTSGAKVTKRGKEGDKVANLKPEELNAYLAAFLFADIVEVCYGCNEGDNLSEQFKNYHIGAKAERFEVWERSETAVDYLKQMNNSSDKLKW